MLIQHGLPENISNTMRVRQRDSIETFSQTDSIVHGPADSYVATVMKFGYPTTCAFKRGSFEYIEDIDGNFGEMNPCYHFVEEWRTGEPVPFHLERKVSGVWKVAIEGYVLFPHSSSAYSTPYVSLQSRTSLGHHPVTGDPDDRWYIPQYQDEAWVSIYPIIKDKLALLNSIYELKDFKRLPSLLRRTRSMMRSLDDLSRQYKWVSEKQRRGELRLIYQLMNGPINPHTWSVMLGLKFNRIKRLSFADILSRLVKTGQVLSEHFLNWKFAVEPLLRDIRGLLTACSTAAQQVDSLLKRAESPVPHKSHWRRTASEDEIPGAVQSSTDWGGTGLAGNKIVSSFEDGPEYSFTAVYEFSYPELAHQLADVLARRDSMGMYISPKNIWNATRWTFIIDWFYNISSMLNYVTPHNLEPVVRFYGACHSIRYSFSDAMFLLPIKGEDYNTADWSKSGASGLAQERKQSVYIRKSVLPFVTLPKTSDFSTMEKLLTLAMASSQLPYKTG